MTIYRGRLINQETQDIMYPQTSYDMIDGTPESLPANGGNAETAEKLVTTIKINGTDFDGSGDIVTEKWGKSRNITIGNTKKELDGGSDAEWTVDEIGVEVGGRNLLLNSTGNLGTSDYWNDKVTVDTTKIFDNCNSLKVTRTDYADSNARWQGSQTLTNTSLQAGDYITISGWIYVDSSVDLGGTTNDISVRNTYDVKVATEDICKFNFGSVEKDTWTYFKATSQLVSTPKSLMFIASLTQNGLIYLSKLKLEKGNVATDWTVAQEDVQESINTLSNALFMISNDDETVTLGSFEEWKTAGKPTF